MIYLDYHAAAPLGEPARMAMEQVREHAYANPSSVHQAGRRCRGWIETAREQVAASIGADPAEVVFTSGGTEACNTAIDGLWARGVSSVILSAAEHPAVLEAARQHTHVLLPSDQEAVSSLEEALTQHPKPALVAMQWVNHETGAISLVADVAALCVEHSLFVDGTQALGRIPVRLADSGIDVAAFASHKIGGPSGVGALWVRRGIDLRSMLVGGGQERGRRAGSPSVEAIVGFGAACNAIDTRLKTMATIARWRDRLEAELLTFGGQVNGAEGPRVASVTNVSMEGWVSAVLVAALDVEGLCVSAGAACSSGTSKASAVVLALYPSDPERAKRAVRLSLGPEMLDGNGIDDAVAILRTVLSR